MPLQNKPYEGVFITIEGGEGAGKSTLIARLSQALKDLGHDVVETREPGGSALSEHIRSLILDSERKILIGEKAELFLFLAARVQHLQENILPALYDGKVVICDRFNDSTVAYQGYARHLGKDYVENLCSLACDGLTPDITLFLDIDPQLGLKRVTEKRSKSFDRLESEHKQFHSEVRQGFLHLADEYSERIQIIDGSLSLLEVVDQSMKVIVPILRKK